MLDIDIRELDKVRTKKETEKLLEQYRKCKRAFESEELYGVNGEKSREVCGYQRNDAEKLVGRVEHAIEGLSIIQKEFIKQRYILSREGEYEYMIKDKLKVADRTYYRIKDGALLGMAESMRIAVYKKEK